MDDRLFPREYSHFMPEVDLEEILRALETKTTIEVTVSPPTMLVESSASHECSSSQIPSTDQSSSMGIRAPFFSSLVTSTNNVYSSEPRKPQSNVISSQAAPVSPHKTFTEMLSSGDEFLWSDFRSSNCQDLINYSNHSISSLNLQTSKPHEESLYVLTGEDDDAEVAEVSRLQSSNSGSFKEPISYNWEKSHIASTSNTFHEKSPFSSAEPPSSIPDSFMCPSSSEDSDSASNKDEGAASSDREPKRMTLEKPSDETADTAEGKKTARKVQKKAIKRQRGPRYALRTRSHVEVMDDGYRWRKYGQKAVKNSPYPRSYYRCTNVDCTVKKRVERSAEDAGLVITTYEGVHTHHCPAAVSGFPGFPLTSFRENAYLPHLLLGSTASALRHPHGQFGIVDPIRGQLQPPATDERLLEDLLLSRTPNNHREF